MWREIEIRLNTVQVQLEVRVCHVLVLFILFCLSIEREGRKVLK